MKPKIRQKKDIINLNIAVQYAEVETYIFLIKQMFIHRVGVILEEKGV